MPSRQFVDLARTGAGEDGADAGAPAPAINGLKVRQVTSRNAPSVINAVFNVRNFWDGRASSIFTGTTPFGDSDTRLNLLLAVGDALVQNRVRMESASLASQSVGPPLNATEMSYAGRSWPKLGKKMLPLVPLALQAVAPDDSVLGEFAGTDTGLRSSLTYAKLVRAAFKPDLWRSTLVVDAGGRVITSAGAPRNSDEFSQMEFNFPLFWAVALQAYQSTLIADDSRFDQHAEGGSGLLSAAELNGLRKFQSGASQCSQCHQGPELTAASFTAAATSRGFDVNRPDGFGFFRIGVSPISDDRGAGNVDDFGFPLFPAAPPRSALGLFKAPGLRNVELTGPYFHSGSAATLDEVMAFYARRGDFVSDENLDPRLASIAIDAIDTRDLTAFMRALTDERVRYERAPFDHPALCVPTGHPEQRPGVLVPNDRFPGAPIAADTLTLVPAVGATGNARPLQTFDELLRGVGNDGTRAHTMTTPCSITAPARIGRDPRS